MNPRIEKVRDDIKRTEAKIRELDEYLKTLRIREKQLCDEELIKVMRSMAGRDGDVIAMLDAFVSSQESDESNVKQVEDSNKKGAGYVAAKTDALKNFTDGKEKGEEDDDEE